MNRVKKYRLAAGLTQAELARRTGLTRNTIAMLEKRGSRLQTMTAKCLSTALKVPADVLAGFTTEGYSWQDGESYEPSKECSYLVAYKPRHHKDYSFTVMDYKNHKWWWTTTDGDLLCEAKSPVLWWSEINMPPV